MPLRIVCLRPQKLVSKHYYRRQGFSSGQESGRAAKGVWQKESGKASDNKVTEASEKVTKK